jgi:isoaspartyl peptidase/L-asparaginase-like protein (Ntn-hydrolase superfamily)
MEGKSRRAGSVAGVTIIRNPISAARAVMEKSAHVMMVGRGAELFATKMGLEIVDPSYFWTERRWRALQQELRKEQASDPEKKNGTVGAVALDGQGNLAAGTSTGGMTNKQFGRVGDSPIIGAGLYVDNEVGAAGSTGRGEANLYNLTSYLIVENMRRGMHPKDAGMDGLKRIKENTVEKRLLDKNGMPAFGISFYILNAKGEYAGVSMFASEQSTFAVCTENGPQNVPLEGLLQRAATQQ